MHFLDAHGKKVNHLMDIVLEETKHKQNTSAKHQLSRRYLRKPVNARTNSSIAQGMMLPSMINFLVLFNQVVKINLHLCHKAIFVILNMKEVD